MTKKTESEEARDSREKGEEAKVIHNPDREQVEIVRILAEADRSQAEAAQLRAMAGEAKAAARIRRAEAAIAEMQLAEKLRFRDREQAKDKWHHKYRYTNAITEGSVKTCIDELTLWHRTAPECAMEIVFNSPGGSVTDGMDLYDYLQELRANGHYITTHTRGMAASMGGILLQAGNHRVMGREAYVLIHQVAAGVVGKIGEIKDEVKFIDLMSDRILNIFASGSAKAFEAGTSEVALSAIQFADGDRELGISGWERTDWWLTSEQCLRFGVVDEIRDS